MKLVFATLLASLVLATPAPVVPCDTDLDCVQRNHHIQELDP